MFSTTQKPAPPEPQAKALYDMTFHYTDKKWWDTNCVDTNDISNFAALYEELYFAHYDTNLFTRIDTFWQASKGYKSDTIPLGLIDYNYHILKDSALFNDKYFIIDSAGQLIDNFKMKYLGGPSGDPNDTSQWGIDYSFDPNPIYQNSDSSSPYLTKNIFSIAAFKSHAPFKQVTYVTDPALMKIGPYQLANYIPDFSLRIDFGDGNGWKTIDHTQKQYHTVSYSSGGSKGIQAGFFDHNGNQLKKGWTRCAPVGNDRIVCDTTWTHIPGITVGKYGACHDENDTNFREKFIIYLPGIDPLEEMTIPEVYDDIQSSSLSDLRNHGYTFLVVDWTNSMDDIRDNADHVIELINYLKCQYLSHTDKGGEQFIVIGHSMGGLVGRYALRKMETGIYPSSGYCRAELNHNTRLFISFDAPQAGANVPLAFQHLYANRLVWSSFFTYNLLEKSTTDLKLLYSDAAKQMLIYHVGNLYNGFSPATYKLIQAFNQSPLNGFYTRTYTAHPDRTAFMNDLTGMGNYGYPIYCKKLAITNGLLDGKNQLRVTGDEAQPGDGFLNLEGNNYANVLGVRVNLLSLNLDLNTSDGSSASRLYRAIIGKKFYRPQIVWTTIIRPFTITFLGNTYTIGITVRIPTGVTVVFDYIESKGREELGDLVEPYSVGPGGFYGLDNISSRIENPVLSTIYTELTNNNLCYNNTSPSLNIPDLSTSLSTNFVLESCSRLQRFNFIPHFSALDYATSSGLPYYKHDISADNTTTKMQMTPFDVIVGLKTEPNFPAQPVREFAQNISHSFGPFNPQLYDNTVQLRSQQPVFFLNREIGEDTLYLSNLTLNRWAEFSTFDYLEAGNALNPFYEYPSTGQQSNIFLYVDGNYDLVHSHNKNHIYSKDGTLIVQPPYTADFYFQAPANVHFSDVGIVGDTLLHPGDTLEPCSLNFRTIKWKIENEAQAHYFSKYKIFPNPTESDLNLLVEVSSRYFPKCTTEKQDCKLPVQFYLYNLQGNRLMEVQREIVSGENVFYLPLSQLGLQTGTYILQSVTPQEIKTFKVIVP